VPWRFEYRAKRMHEKQELARTVGRRLPLRQPPQIERRIGRFFRGQRLRRADDALGGGVVARAVDRFHHRELAVAEAEG
jgi:hypothetical protein